MVCAWMVNRGRVAGENCTVSRAGEIVDYPAQNTGGRSCPARISGRRWFLYLLLIHVRLTPR